MTAHERLVEHLANSALDAEDSAHASRCRACAALLSRERGAAAPLPQVHSEFLALAHREVARPARPWWLLAGGLALLNALLAAAAVAHLEAWNWDASQSPRWLFLAAATVLALLATLGALLAFAPRRGWLDAGLLLAAAAPVVVLLAADGNVANGRFLDGTACLWTVFSLALLPLAAGAALLTSVAYSAVRALSVGLVSAGVGLLVLQFHCADGGSAHLLVFHLLPWALLGAVAVVLRRVLPTSSHAP